MDSIVNKNAKIGKTIHLIRHGQTDFNLQNIIQGSGIDSPLNSNGLRQAQLFYEHYRNLAYNRVYTSMLSRAIQSVMPFIEAGIPHSSMASLNEINWGIMEGRKSNPETAGMYNEIVSHWTEGRLDIAIDGGETPNEMYKRQSEGLRQIMAAEGEDLILICMHGRALRSFLCLLTGTPLKNMEQWQHSNLCLYELKFNGEFFEITRANDIQHLHSM